MKNVQTRVSRRFLAGFVSYALGDFIRTGLSVFLLVPLFTNTLHPEEYGIVATLSAVGVFFNYLLQFGMPSAVFRLYFKYQSDEEKRTYLGSTFFFGLCIAATMAIILTTFGKFLWNRVIINAPFDVYGAYVIWGSFFQVVILYRSVLLRAQERPKLYVALDLLQFLCLLALAFMFVVVQKQGAIGQVRAAFLTSSIFAGISIFILVRNVRLILNRNYVLESLRFGLPVFFTYVIVFFVSRVNIIVLQYFLAGSIVGVYALGQQLGNFVNIISLALEKAWQPVFYSHKAEKARELMLHYLNFSIEGYIVLAVGLGVFAPEIVHFLSAEAYSDAWIIVAIIAFGAAFTAISSVPNGAIYYMHRSESVAWITAAGAVVNVGFSVLLIKLYGVLGVAFASALSSVTILFLASAMMKRYFNVKFPYLQLARSTGLGIMVVLIISIIFGGISSTSPFIVLAVKMVIMLLFIGFLWVLQPFRHRYETLFRNQLSVLIRSRYR